MYKRQAPDISLYNGLFPQLLLFMMSLAVIITAFYLMFLFNKLIHFNSISVLLYYIGIILVIFSVSNVLYKIKIKYNYAIFISVFLAALVLDMRAYILFILIVLSLLYLSEKKVSKMCIRDSIYGYVRRKSLQCSKSCNEKQKFLSYNRYKLPLVYRYCCCSRYIQLRGNCRKNN